jgi:hypothetical protein
MSWSTRASILSGLAFIYALFAIGGASPDVVFWGFLLLMSGLPVLCVLGEVRCGSGFRVHGSGFKVHEGCGP